MSATSATVYVRRRLATGPGRVGGRSGSPRAPRCGRAVGGTARMIDVRFMVSIVRKDDSSNHSHDHTHDRYHLGGNVGMTTRITPFPRSAPPSTHTTTHTPCVSLLRLDRCRLPSSRLDDVTMTRLDRVWSTMPRAVRHVDGAGPGRSRRSLGHQGSLGSSSRGGVRNPRACAGRWVGWSRLRTSRRLRQCQRVRSFDNRVELRRPAT
jgi:hypothetical protein